MNINDSNSNNNSLTAQLKKVFQDAIDYAASALRLLQAQTISMALSSVAFLLLIFFAVLAAITSFVLLSVAIGIWLTHFLGNAGWALLAMGFIYVLITVILGGIALRWLKRLNS